MSRKSGFLLTIALLSIPLYIYMPTLVVSVWHLAANRQCRHYHFDTAVNAAVQGHRPIWWCSVQGTYVTHVVPIENAPDFELETLNWRSRGM